MENVILGILLKESMSLYEIRGFVKRNLNSFCSDSIGSIQAALKKLMTNHRIECKESFEHRVVKKVFSITEEGCNQFKEWIATPFNFSKICSVDGSRVFFLGMASASVRLDMLEKYREELIVSQTYLKELAEYLDTLKGEVIGRTIEQLEGDEQMRENSMEVANSNNLEDIVTNIFKYQFCSLEYGLKRCEFDIRWIDEIINKEKS